MLCINVFLCIFVFDGESNSSNKLTVTRYKYKRFVIVSFLFNVLSDIHCARAEQFHSVRHLGLCPITVTVCTNVHLAQRA